MGISRKVALTRIAGLSLRIAEHVEKIRSDPGSVAYNHWRAEADQLCAEVEELARHVGRKTQAEVLAHVTQWKQALREASTTRGDD